LQSLAEGRIKDAQALYRSGRYDGAYYMAGYAVECALKACVAKKTRKNDFPDKDFANKVFTHDLTRLLELAGLADHFAQEFKKDAVMMARWQTVTKWNEGSRYQARGRKGKEEAANMLSAIAAPGGILECIKNFW
jgi:HEPN domain-containing protein